MTLGTTNFNPRSPRGERHSTKANNLTLYPFQSTLPSRGATKTRFQLDVLPEFQSTLPSRGATSEPEYSAIRRLYFNPRSPRGERPLQRGDCGSEKRISIHAPLAGSDAGEPSGRVPDCRFQSTLPSRGATATFPKKHGKVTLKFI